MKFAYADPPYIGMAKKHYSDDPRCAEVNHAELIAQLCDEFSDGWALSCSATTLHQVLDPCPADVRFGPWCKPFTTFWPGVNPSYSWEALVWRGGRKRTKDQLTVRDYCIASMVAPSKRKVRGQKPPEFVEWLLSLLNFRPEEDTLADLFPGSGVVTEMARQQRIAL